RSDAIARRAAGQRAALVRRRSAGSAARGQHRHHPPGARTMSARAINLRDLLRGIADAPRAGDIVVTGLTQDSHAVRAGDAFVALQGARTHGIAFVPQALERGAAAVLAEKTGDGNRE